MKPYRVEFQFSYPSVAEIYVCADNEDLAAEGAKEILSSYDNLTITSVSTVEEKDKKVN